MRQTELSFGNSRAPTLRAPVDFRLNKDVRFAAHFCLLEMTRAFTRTVRSAHWEMHATCPAVVLPSVPSLQFSYPEGDPDAVTIRNADVQRLEPGEFLNDNIIDFCLKRLQVRLLVLQLHGGIAGCRDLFSFHDAIR